MRQSPADLKDAAGAGVLDPLNLLGYGCWLAVASSPIGSLLSGASTWNTTSGVGLVALLALLALFVLRGYQQKRGVPLSWLQATAVAQAILALTACWAFPDGLQPALLVMVASQMTMFEMPMMIALLFATNVVMTKLLFAHPIPHEPPKIVLASMYWGLQTFAVFVWLYARRDREARIELQRINQELLATRHLLDEGVRAEERLRVARELHDVTGHKLTALKLQLSLQARGVSDAASVEACARLSDEVLGDIRGVVSELRRHEGVNLQQALRSLDPGLPSPKIVFDLDPDLRIADMRSAEALLRCAQEGMTNALRHSGASSLRIALQRSVQGVTLTVDDNGSGRSGTLQPGNGLRGLRERLEEIGGCLQIHDRLPSGLSLQVLLPDSQAPAC